MAKITDIRTMKKDIEYLKGIALLRKCIKYWNELANTCFIEYMEINPIDFTLYDKSNNDKNIVWNIELLIDEALYFLSLYYEDGHMRHDEEFEDRKHFLKFLKVFTPYVKIYKSQLKYIPKRKETEFLYDVIYS